MKQNPLLFLVAAALAVAVLSLLLVRDGWLISFPILLALAVAAYVSGTVRR